MGVDWFRHFSGYPYKGITFHLYLFSLSISLTIVNDGKKYDRHQDDIQLKKKKWLNRLQERKNG